MHTLLQAARPGTPIHWRNDFDILRQDLRVPAGPVRPAVEH